VQRKKQVAPVGADLLTLTKKYVLKDFLYKSLVQFHSNTKILQGDYLQPLVEAARSHCYVENAGNKADSLHRRIKQAYEESIANAYLKTLAPWVKKQHLGIVDIACDFTTEDFYGYTSDLWLHGWTGEQGVQAHYQFAVMSLVGKHKIPLMAVPVHCGMSKEEIFSLFLAVAKKLKLHARCILLDAGFYSGEVIEALKGYKYLIRAPRNEVVERFIAATEDWNTYAHEIEWSADKTTHRTKTTIVIVRNVPFKHKQLVDCSYATNMHLGDGMSYVHLYCKRWQIETNFRMEDQVRIKSKSRYIIVRYFYFLMSLLLHALWLLTWSGKIAFDMFKVRLANQLFLESYGLTYVNAVF